jgi:hypothetical protein
LLQAAQKIPLSASKNHAAHRRHCETNLEAFLVTLSDVRKKSPQAIPAP